MLWSIWPPWRNERGATTTTMEMVPRQHSDPDNSSEIPMQTRSVTWACKRWWGDPGYRVPTGRRHGKRGGWYVSNVLLFFIVPCYYIICFGCLMGFNIPFYIIFGTNLLTEGPVQFAVFFCLFQCFAKKEYQTEWNLREDFFFGTNAIHETWSGSQGSNEAATRQEGVPRGVRRAPILVGPS